MFIRAFLTVCALSLLAPAATAKDIVVFAAASTVKVIGEVGAAWEETTGDRIRPVLASSGALARQIEAGAPAGLFLSANAGWVDYLVEKSAVRPETRQTVFHNRLVLIAPAGSPATAALDRETGTYRALSDGNRIAIGDPAHVPVGMYARKALEGLGIWAATAPRAARTQNVRLALALVERGEAALGIVYRTDAIANPRVRIVEAYPAHLHGPIRYVAIATRTADEQSLAFLRFLRSGRAVAIYRKYGFVTD